MAVKTGMLALPSIILIENMLENHLAWPFLLQFKAQHREGVFGVNERQLSSFGCSSGVVNILLDEVKSVQHQQTTSTST